MMQEDEKETHLVTKKLKLDSETNSSNNSQHIQTKGTLKPAAILAEQYTRTLETVCVYVADLQNPKLASKYIRKLKEIFPLKELQHLKRVKRSAISGKGEILQLLIKPVSNDELLQQKCAITSETLLDMLGKEWVGLGQPYIVEVPKDIPLTREQFDEASKLWSTSFFEDKYITKMISGELFDDVAVCQINNYMSLAIGAAKKGKNIGMVAMGAVVVDPLKEKVIAVAYDLRCHGDPLQHAVMVAVDLVAQSQAGGSWNLGCKQDNGIWTLYDKSKKTSTSIIDKDEKIVENINASQTDKTGPYLCTGYDMYVTREPCIMCAMSLVHSRIRRVFYGCKDTIVGALGSRYSIHVQHGLNHHYEAFCGVLEDQCHKLYMNN